MPWSNGPLTVYHGCDDQSANNIVKNGINLALCKVLTDFGQGFYTTTSLKQAKNWANQRCNRIKIRGGGTGSQATGRMSTEIQFDIDRDLIARQEILFFIIENSNSDYWDFVTHCRTVAPVQHKPTGGKYDVVAGPVSLWPQRLIIKDCDQISFHTPNLLRSLQRVRNIIPDKNDNNVTRFFP